MAYITVDGSWHYIDSNGRLHQITLKRDTGCWSMEGLNWTLPSQSSESKKLAEYDVIDQQDDEENNAG